MLSSLDWFSQGLEHVSVHLFSELVDYVCSKIHYTMKAKPVGAFKDLYQELLVSWIWMAP